MSQKTSLSKPSIFGIICDRSCVPEDCEWEEAQELHEYYYNFLLLDEDGLMPLRDSIDNWILVDFPTFEHYYALYLLGIDPIHQYKQDITDAKIQKQTAE